MKVFVQVAMEMDPAIAVRIPRGATLPLPHDGDTLFRVSPMGRIGVDLALSLPGAEVTAFALGGGHEPALRHALAAGVSRAVILGRETPFDDLSTAEPLATWLRSEGAALVLADRLAGPLAARLGWAHLAGLGDLTLKQGCIEGVRALARGDRERVQAKLPATVHPDVERQPPYIAFSRIQAASEKKIATVRLPQPEPTALEAGPWQLARARTRLGTTSAPAAPAGATGASRLQALMGAPSKPAAAKSHGAVRRTPTELAEELVRYLAHHKLLPEGEVP